MYRPVIRKLIPAALGPIRAQFSTSVVRRNIRGQGQGPSYQPPSSPSSPPSSNRHRDFYKSFGRPTAKVFLVAWATYQILYWSWSKLEFMEEKEEKQAELARLQAELQDALRLNQRKEGSKSPLDGSLVSVHPSADKSSPSTTRSWWNIF